MKSISKRLICLMVMTLVACGGGGGSDGGTNSSGGSGTGGSGNGNTSVNSTLVAITQENGEDIASAALSGIYVVEDREETID